jgi:beta-glucosidase-like glycosyl hydrolase
LRKIRSVFSLLSIVSIILSMSLSFEKNVQAEVFPYQNPNLSVDQRVTDLLSRMTLDEKIGQMLQVERLTATQTQTTDYFLGSILSGGGSNPTPNTAEEWANMVDSYQGAAMATRLRIPILYGVDAVHGHNNVYGATIFPHNIGLGATRDTNLVKRVAAATAKEVRTTGISWDFSPCLCSPQDIRWGRTYEGFSEDPFLVSQMGVAYTQGLQGLPSYENFLKGSKVVGTIKHWLGDGNTTNGDDQGNVQSSEQNLQEYIKPYKDAIDAGAKTVMVSLSTWNGTESHHDYHLVTEILKNNLGFKGIVVSDWNGTKVLSSDYRFAVKTAVNAGIDIFMEPENWQQFIPVLKDLVNSGEVSQARIDDAVSRILRVKFEAGLFENPYTDRTLLSSGTFGGAEHRAIAREAVRKSATLLKNENHILPLSKNLNKVFVAGTKANDIGYQSGGWTISWQGSPGNITKGTTILQGIENTVSASTSVQYDANGYGASGSDVAIVVVGEEPYAEMFGDVGENQPKASLTLSNEDIALLNNVKSTGVPMVVIMLSGRPMIITDQINDWNAFVASWLPGSEGQGLADVLFGGYDFTGKLPITWPRSMEQIPVNRNSLNADPLFPLGYGLSADILNVKSLPGVIEAENHNASSGIQHEQSLDINGSLNAGWLDAGDWMDYKVNVPKTGKYVVSLRVASPTGATSAFQLNNSSSVLSSFDIPNTGGWQNWKTIAKEITLNEGVQTIRIFVESPGWNINWIEFASADNLLTNPGLETGNTNGWILWNNGTNAEKVDTDLPYSGSYKLSFWAPSPYQQLASQSRALPNGVYKFTAWVRSGGGQNSLHLFAKNYGGTEMTTDVRSASADTWRQYTIDNIQVTNGQIEVGIWSDANANNWAVFDNFELVKK